MKSESIPAIIAELSTALQGLSPVEQLQHLAAKYPQGVRFATSLGMEDQVITHLIAANKLPIDIFSLETGRLFEQTLSLWAQTEAHYGIRIAAFYPQRESLENLVAEQGINGFYHSIDQRKKCCFVRKVEPLQRALQGAQVWITGLRKEQSVTRTLTPLVEWDADLLVLKVNPLIDWTWEQVQDFVQQNQVPVNELHAQGYPTIGCAPCTRASTDPHDLRSGRWWWEPKTSLECGLHLKKGIKS